MSTTLTPEQHLPAPPKNVLVVGSSGRIGRDLCARLVARGVTPLRCDLQGQSDLPPVEQWAPDAVPLGADVWYVAGDPDGAASEEQAEMDAMAAIRALDRAEGRARLFLYAGSPWTIIDPERPYSRGKRKLMRRLIAPGFSAATATHCDIIGAYTPDGTTPPAGYEHAATSPDELFRRFSLISWYASPAARAMAEKHWPAPAHTTTQIKEVAT